MVDASERLSTEDVDVLKYVNHKDFIVLLNKVDIGKQVVSEDILVYLAPCRGTTPPVIEVSVKNGTNIDEVKKFLLEMVWGGRIDLGADAMAVNLRHRSSLERAKASLEQFMQTLDNSCELELLSFDLREGLDRIDEVLGVTADEDVLEQIFAEFCIGK